MVILGESSPDVWVPGSYRSINSSFGKVMLTRTMSGGSHEVLLVRGVNVPQGEEG